MKAFFLCSFIFFSFISFAQHPDHSACHYLKFEFELKDSLLFTLDPGELESRTDKERFASNKNHFFQGMRGFLRDSMLYALEQKEVAILDNEVLSKYIKLGTEGFPLLALSPKGPIKKLKKKGYEADLYLTLESKIELAGFSAFSKGIQPIIEIRLNAWDSDGNAVQKIVHKEKSKQAILGQIDRDNEYIKFKKTKPAKGFSNKYVQFDKTERAFIDLLMSELEPLMKLAVDNTLSKWE